MVLDIVMWFLKQSGYLNEGHSRELSVIQAEFKFS